MAPWIPPQHATSHTAGIVHHLQPMRSMGFFEWDFNRYPTQIKYKKGSFMRKIHVFRIFHVENHLNKLWIINFPEKKWQLFVGCAIVQQKPYSLVHQPPSCTPSDTRTTVKFEEFATGDFPHFDWRLVYEIMFCRLCLDAYECNIM